MTSLTYKAVLVVIVLPVVLGIQCWVCENAAGEAECKEKGEMKECPKSETMCQTQLRHGGWGDFPIVEKSCKRLSACGSNHIQNNHMAWTPGKGLQIQCNEKPPSSVCRCCCTADFCNFNVTSCLRGNGHCNDLGEFKYGEMDCTEGNLPFSSCSFKCKLGYHMEGSDTLTCGYFDEWDKPKPVCKPIRCKRLKAPKYGRMTCTTLNSVGSRCTFSCEEGYKLKYPETKVLTCITYINEEYEGVWSRRQPECQPLECPPQRLRHGNFQCTNARYVQSRCNFQCNKAQGYELYPPAPITNQCQRNEEWNRPAPCCILPCPPFALMDFVVILDSSSSVGADNWVLMVEFVKTFLQEFNIREDSTNVGIFRYNRKIDTESQILLNEFTHDMGALIRKFDQMMYDGQGTHTGQALDYASNVMFTTINGNRPVARDVALLITDGISQDKIAEPAKKIRDMGVLLYVLPIKPPRGSLNLTEIEVIAGDPNNVLRDALEGGFEALDREFSEKISTTLCGDPCVDNPTHHHDDDE